MPEIVCYGCSARLSAQEFLDGSSAWWERVDCLQFRCCRCAATFEVRIESGQVTFGYTYAAGGPHFAGMVPISVPEIGARPLEQGLQVTFGPVTKLVERLPQSDRAT